MHIPLYFLYYRVVMGIVNNMEFYCDINTMHYEISLDFFLLQWSWVVIEYISVNVHNKIGVICRCTITVYALILITNSVFYSMAYPDQIINIYFH
jgi:hypothetical protein